MPYHVPGTSQTVARNAKIESMDHESHDAQSKVKMTPKGKGMLTDGFTKLSLPEDKSPKPLQLKATRDSVGAKWPGPGKQLHGKASPSSKESFVRVAHNKEFQAK